jgi:hypothetical protein
MKLMKLKISAIFENLIIELNTCYIQIISGFFAYLRIIVEAGKVAAMSWRNR